MTIMIGGISILKIHLFIIFLYLMKKATATKTTPKKLMEPAEVKKLFAKLTSRLLFIKREIKV